MSEKADQHRRNLVGLCFIMLIYIFGAGEPNSDGSFLGGSFKLEHPIVVEYAAIILLIYWLYRFYLSHRNPFPNLDNCINVCLSQDDKLKASVSKHVSDQNIGAKINEYFDQCIKKNSTSLQFNDEYNTLLSGINLNKNVHITPFNLTVILNTADNVKKNYKAGKAFKRVVNAQITNGRNSTIGNLTFTFRPTVEIYNEIKAWAKAIFNQEDFWDTLFPYLLFTITIIAIIYKDGFSALNLFG